MAHVRQGAGVRNCSARCAGLFWGLQRQDLGSLLHVLPQYFYTSVYFHSISKKKEEFGFGHVPCVLIRALVLCLRQQTALGQAGDRLCQASGY